MRVSLPVYPHNKTLGEVTTLRFLRRATDVPVPEVIAFDDSGNNEIGFEWILMECMPGISAYKIWRTLSAFQKAALVQPHPQKEQPGEMVSARGPFRSSYDWLCSYLEVVIKDQITAKEEAEEAEDEEDEEDAAFALGLAHRLVALLPKIFPSLQNPPERSVLLHEDLSLNNILVDGQGNITAIINWECVSAMPLWMATKVPKFLNGSIREQEPKREEYADESAGESDESQDGEDDQLNNEGKNELYWIHLMEYEKTQLRRLYHVCMGQLRPGWDAEVEDSALKEDFAGAVFGCGQGFHVKRIAQWIDAIGKV
ncbi:unnamed protein product [Penicillium glandicola]